MKLSNHDQFLLLLALYALSKLDQLVPKIVPAAERAGAKAFEVLHPSQAEHRDDLPGHQMTKQAIVELARKVGFPDPNLAAAVAMAESGGVPNAMGDLTRGISVGLWQINLEAHPEYTHDDMQRPPNNALAAFKISKAGTDWRPWTMFRNGVYRRFL